MNESYVTHRIDVAKRPLIERIAHVIHTAQACCCDVCYDQCEVDDLELAAAQAVAAYLNVHHTLTVERDLMTDSWNYEYFDGVDTHRYSLGGI